VFNEVDDGVRRDFGVISVRSVNCPRFPFGHVNGEGLPPVDLGRIVGAPMVADEVFQERVGARREVRGVREAQDVLVGGGREARYLAESGILELLTEKRQKVLPTRVLAIEGEAEALHSTGLDSDLLGRLVDHPELAAVLDEELVGPNLRATSPSLPPRTRGPLGIGLLGLGHAFSPAGFG
jgi:hypothetical protein